MGQAGAAGTIHPAPCGAAVTAHQQTEARRRDVRGGNPGGASRFAVSASISPIRLHSVFSACGRSRQTAPEPTRESADSHPLTGRTTLHDTLSLTSAPPVVRQYSLPLRQLWGWSRALSERFEASSSACVLADCKSECGKAGGGLPAQPRWWHARARAALRVRVRRRRPRHPCARAHALHELQRRHLHQVRCPPFYPSRTVSLQLGTLWFLQPPRVRVCRSRRWSSSRSVEWTRKQPMKSVQSSQFAVRHLRVSMLLRRTRLFDTQRHTPSAAYAGRAYRAAAYRARSCTRRASSAPAATRCGSTVATRTWCGPDASRGIKPHSVQTLRHRDQDVV